MEIKELLQLHQETFNIERDNLDESLKDTMFRAGFQWPEAILAARLAEKRPVIVANQINKFVNRVVGEYLRNPQEIKIIPQDSLSDPQVAEVLNGLIRNIDNNSQSDAVYAKVFDDCVCGGAGYVRVRNIVVDYDSYGQELLVEAVPNPLTVAFDPDATGYTKSDAMFCFVHSNYTKRKFKEIYPDAAISPVGEADFSVGAQYNSTWYEGDYVRVGEFWEKSFTKHDVAIFEDGSVVDLTEIGQKASDMPKGIARVEKRDFPKIKQYIFSGAEIIEENDWPGMHIPIIPMIGQEYYVNERRIRSGLVRNLRDPQFMYNVSRSVQLEAIALQPKAPFMVTPNQIAGFENMYLNANNSNFAYLLYNPDPASPGHPKRAEPPIASQGLTQMSDLFNKDLQDISGIYDSSLGAKSNETSGVAIKSRQEQSQTTNFMFSDHAQYTKQQVGRVLVDLIPKIYTGQKVQRILNDDKTSEYVQLNTPFTDENGKIRILNDLNLGRYDVIVTIGPDYATRRQEISETMLKLMQLMPNNPEWTAAVAYKFIQNLDIPDGEEIAEIAKRFVNPEVLGEAPVMQDNIQQALPTEQPQEGIF